MNGNEYIGFYSIYVPAIVTWEAPAALQAAAVTKPIGPAPKMNTLSPNLTLPLLEA